MTDNNTRTFPRSLAQAWPKEHANPITRYASTGRADYAVRLILFFGVLAVIASIVWGNV